MKKLILAGLVALIVCGSALAAATPTFTATGVGDRTFVFDASSSPCRYGPCSFNWRYFTPTGNHLGVQMGNTARITYRFPAPGAYTVVVKEGERCSAGTTRTCAGTAQQTIRVG
ncbi:MAG: hypothetical protein QOH00_3998 [Gaiellales bacterium]|nr:hypothetical protein [Gaiellales bacterium]